MTPPHLNRRFARCLGVFLAAVLPFYVLSTSETSARNDGGGRAEDDQPTSSDASPRFNWYRGNTHMHTMNADGDSTPIEAALWYREHGYQFVFITDHEYATEVGPVNAAVGAKGRFIVFPGQEVTQTTLAPSKRRSFLDDVMGAALHVNALFTDELIEPLGIRSCSERWCTYNAPADMPVQEVYARNIERIRSAGGLAQVNHPNHLWSVDPEDLREVPDHTLLEIWNGVVNNLGGADDNGHVALSGEGFWDWLLSRGKIVWGVGSDDSHVFRQATLAKLNELPPGAAWIVVRAEELSQQAIKDALRRGEFYASRGPKIVDISATERAFEIVLQNQPLATGGFQALRYSTKFVGANGKVLETVAGSRPKYVFKGSEEYVRAVITDSNGRLAWTQPVFLDGRKDATPYRRGE